MYFGSFSGVNGVSSSNRENIPSVTHEVSREVVRFDFLI